MIGHRGLYLEMSCADLPVVVITIIAAASLFMAALTTAIAIEVVASAGVGVFAFNSINIFYKT